MDIKKSYVEFLNSFSIPTTFSYCINEGYIKNEEGEYKKTGKYSVSKMEMGHNAYLPIKVEIVKEGNISTLFNLKYLEVECEFRVYSPTNISPDVYKNRINNSISNIISNIQDEDTINKLKDFYNNSRNNFNASISKAMNNSLFL